MSKIISPRRRGVAINFKMDPVVDKVKNKGLIDSIKALNTAVLWLKSLSTHKYKATTLKEPKKTFIKLTLIIGLLKEKRFETHINNAPMRAVRGRPEPCR